MQTIKFSHRNYYKMPIALVNRKTYLIGLQKVNYKDLPIGFINYDTLYETKNILKHYQLPATDLIVLTLFTDSDQSPKIWTTVRRFTPKKYEYYKNNLNKEFRIVIEDELKRRGIIK